MRTPRSKPRRVRPKFFKPGVDHTGHKLAPIEKPLPMDPHLGDRIAVFARNHSPSMFECSGPPELPTVNCGVGLDNSHSMYSAGQWARCAPIIDNGRHREPLPQNPSPHPIAHTALALLSPKRDKRLRALGASPSHQPAISVLGAVPITSGFKFKAVKNSMVISSAGLRSRGCS